MHHKETSLFLRTFSNSKFWSGLGRHFPLCPFPPSSFLPRPCRFGPLGAAIFLPTNPAKPSLLSPFLDPFSASWYAYYSLPLLRRRRRRIPCEKEGKGLSPCHGGKKRAFSSTVSSRGLPSLLSGLRLERGGEEGRGYGVGGGGATLLPLLV